MAEFVFKKFVAEKGENDFYVESAATSSEELGNPVYPPARRVLNRLNIDCSDKFARKIVPIDYENFDYIIGMDDMNIRAMKNFFGGDKENKIYKLLDFTEEKGDVADPWYTGDFERTLKDVERGITGFYDFLKNNRQGSPKN